MGTEIYYLTGTGNSLHIARELQRRIPGTALVPMVGALRSGRLQSSAETVGLVFPIHAFTMPLTVAQFLREADLGSASYLFAVATRDCMAKVFADVDRILAGQGRSLDASFSFEMPQNYIAVFEVPSESKIAQLESAAQQSLDEIQAVVVGRQPRRQEDGAILSLLAHSLAPVITLAYHRTRYFGLERAFYAGAECTGCGLCERVCLSDKIRLVDGVPQWDPDVPCTFCFACIHFCPARAIQVRRRRTAQRARYHHPQISAADIAAQKSWGQ